MTDGRPAMCMARFSMPILLGCVVQQAYGWFNTFVIAQYLGVTALGALGVIGTLQYFINGFIAGMNVGMTIRLSQANGAGEPQAFRRCWAAALWIAGGCGLALALLMQLGLSTVLTAMNTPAEVLPEAMVYSRIYFLALPFSGMSGAVTSALYAKGESRAPLLVTMLTCAVNILLDWVLLVRLKMGIQGAALGTVLVAALTLCVYARILARSFPELLYLRGVRATLAEIRRVVGLGLPMALQSSFTSVGVMVLQSGINALGANVTAAFAAVSRVENFSTITHATLGTAVATFTAQNYGARKMDRVRGGVRAALIMVLAASLVTSGLIFLLGKPVLGLFIPREATEVMAYALYDLRYLGWLLWALGCIAVFRNVVQGLGDGVLPMSVGIMECVLRSGLTLWAMRAGGFREICLINPAIWMIVFLVLGYACRARLKRLNHTI